MKTSAQMAFVVSALLAPVCQTSAACAQEHVSQTDILRDYYLSTSRWPTSLAEMMRHYKAENKPHYVEYLVDWDDCSAVVFEPNSGGSLTVSTWSNSLRLPSESKTSTRLEGMLLAFRDNNGRWPNDRTELENELRESEQDKALRFVERFTTLSFKVRADQGLKEVTTRILVKWDIDVSDEMKVDYDRQQLNRATYFRPR